MEFKEIQVATLSKEDKDLIEKLVEADGEAIHATAKVEAGRHLLWVHLRGEHNLTSSEAYFIKDGNIYQRILE